MNSSHMTLRKKKFQKRPLSQRVLHVETRLGGWNAEWCICSAGGGGLRDHDVHSREQLQPPAAHCPASSPDIFTTLVLFQGGGVDQ